MKYLSMFPGAPRTSALGFGTTSLMGAANTKERMALLEAAFAAGIRHFDTAPYYGYGEAERILGDFLRGKRDQVTIATKYGIQPPAVVKSRWVNLMARRVLRCFPFLRKAFSRRAQAMSKKTAFSADEAKRSLDQSLAALRTDCIDFFVLHEPTYQDAASHSLCQLLEQEVRNGRIRSYGCGGEFPVILDIASARLSSSHWLQFEDNAWIRHIEEIRPMGARCLTFRTFHQALGNLVGFIEDNPVRRQDWEARLELDLGEPGILAGLLQAASHLRNPDGIVLFSTRRFKHIEAAAAVASGERFPPEQVRMFDELVRMARSVER